MFSRIYSAGSVLLLALLVALSPPLSAQRGGGNGGGRPGSGGGGDGTKAYRAAEVFTVNSVLYGRFEFRMRAAEGSGIISNFFTWKDGSEMTGVDWEEVDIEVFGKDGATSWQSNIITAGNPRTTSEEVHQENLALAAGYHTYVLEWTPGSVTWYVDGVLRRQSTGAQVDQLISPAQLRFNIWNPDIPAWVGAFDPAVLPVQMLPSTPPATSRPPPPSLPAPSGAAVAAAAPATCSARRPNSTSTPTRPATRSASRRRPVASPR